VTQGLDWVAGLANLKAWAASRRPILDQRALDFGLQPAKGLLLTGVPGCGKSMSIKALAATWQLPLLRLDAGSLMAKFIGESEQNLRSAFDVCTALSPSILWIDELEKAFSSRGASEADGGLGFRLLGMLLTWMQEREAPVFLAATANNIDALPPELTRQGRFDQIFFVDLPEHAERAHLFALQLAQRRRNHEAFDCDALAAASAGFSGAEIEQCVVSALYDAYAAGVDIDTAAILVQVERSVPLSRSAPERIERIRAWGRERAVPA
jgi:SpoVK/Ycf46/Vps4 family AAA+-type ATPase